MLQIDDAGSGSFVGGTCIGVYRPETNEFYFDIIPVELYSKTCFKEKRYLDEVLRIVTRGIELFQPMKSEMIEICRGYMFERLKGWLDEQGYSWYCTQITGRAQEVVEASYMRYAQRLGLPWKYIRYTKYPFHFHKLLHWVFADFENRISLCKTGWNSWQSISDSKPSVHDGSMYTDNLICLKCGKMIRRKTPVTIVSYQSNHPYDVFLHRDC